MKKIIRASTFSILLAVVLQLSLLGSATAAPLPSSLPDPVVTPVSGDMEFTTELLPVQQFPGAQEYNQMLVPVGFPLGEAQFLDTGVVVSGMDSGTATACFYFTGAESGWGGKVGVWNGTKWVLLPTTITDLEESPNSLACAPITGNGYYAFIKYISSPEKLPTGKPWCQVTLLGFFQQGVDGGGTRYFDMLGVFPEITNSLVTYTIIDPGMSITGDLTGSVLSDATGNFSFSGYSWVVPESYTFILHLETSSCYVEYVRVHYVEDNEI
ncbi:MAG: hypothetical protein GYA36_22155 [Veillonellaceae bacterium]|nr:hypothetical protein [Veillonellaceae bacterium]